jgi:hypothetical protein
VCVYPTWFVLSRICNSISIRFSYHRETSSPAVAPLFVSPRRTFINMYDCVILFVVLLFVDFHSRFLLSPLLVYSIKFVHRGYTEFADLEGIIPSEGHGLEYVESVAFCSCRPSFSCVCSWLLSVNCRRRNFLYSTGKPEYRADYCNGNFILDSNFGRDIGCPDWGFFDVPRFLE